MKYIKIFSIIIVSSNPILSLHQLKKGLNIVRGDVVYQAVAEAFNMKYTKLNF